MRRGEIRLVEFDPARGSEANKTRPAVIVSNNGANAAALRTGRGVVTVLPLTSDTEQIHPFQVRLGAAECGIDRDSKAQAEQIRAVAADRIGRTVGVVPAGRMADLGAALRLHLAL